MSKITEYDRGFRDGVRWASTYSHAFAQTMNHPPARAAVLVLSVQLVTHNPKRKPQVIAPGLVSHPPTK